MIIVQQQQDSYEYIAEIIEEQIKYQFERHFAKFNNESEWLDLKSAAKYAGVSYNTFIKFRKMGLKVTEIDGIKRVKKSEIDRFLEKYSY